jgi:hypothetical protein
MIPRRALLLLTAAVLGLHALVLGLAAHSGLPVVVSPAPVVFHTRTVAPLAPAAGAAVAAPPAVAPPAAKPRPAAQRKPRPAKAPAPVPEPRPSDPPPEVEVAMAPTPPASAPEDSASQPLPQAVADGASAPDVAPAPAPQATASGSSAPAAPPGIAVLASGGAPDGAGVSQVPVLLPPPARLDFEVQGQAKRLQYSASAELVWQHDGQQYQARQEIRVLFLGSRAQTSVGEITPLGLQPRRFGDRSRSEKAAHFDFAQGQVTFSANSPSARIAPGAQDRLSVFLQLSAMLAAAPAAYPVGTRIQVPTVSSRAADLWTFTIGDTETLDLPLGPVRAVALERLPVRDYDQKAQVWLAPELDYLPVRIRITQTNGDYAELNLRARQAP